MNYLSPLIFILVLLSFTSCSSLPQPDNLMPGKTLAGNSAKSSDDSQFLKNHLGSDTVQSATEKPNPLKPITRTTFLPKPQQQPQLQLYTVVVNDVPLQELLFSLARDTKLNVDIDQDINAQISLNAIDQTLPQLLERISELANIRYEILDQYIRITKDSPFIRSYRVDYLNMSRDSSSSINVSTELSAAGGDNSSEGGGGSSSANNNSQSKVRNISNNNFWDTLTANIGLILHAGLEGQANDYSKEDANPNIIVNRESGIIAVRATYQDHRKVQAFISEVLHSSQRQVLIEATIAEITLSDKYQAGIDWSVVTSGSNATSIVQSLTAADLAQAPFFSLNSSNNSGGNVISTAVNALEVFGDVKVMSSPKVMTLNNQTALLKVVDNIVYFNLEVDSVSVEGSGVSTEFTTTANTIPVGFVMSVTPYISEHDEVTLNVRPTISRIIGQARDPNPELAKVNVISEVPIIQVREVESILRVKSRETAVIGGLMQDRLSESSREVPFLNRIPWLGELFRFENNEIEKTELVIFIRPIVIHHASINDDLKDYQRYLPPPMSRSSL